MRRARRPDTVAQVLIFAGDFVGIADFANDPEEESL